MGQSCENFQRFKEIFETQEEKTQESLMLAEIDE